MIARRKFWLSLITGLLAVNLLIGFHVYSKEADKRGEPEAFEKISVMMRVLHLIRKDYVDQDKVDFTNLIYSALRGMVSSLDPFSSFMAPEEYNDMMESTEGQFGGLGIIVTVRDNMLTIVAPIEGTPGGKADLRAGDLIIKISGEATKNLDLHDVVKQLKGEPGTEVTITIYRPGTEETKDITLERAIIPVVSIKDEQILENQIGYVRILQFSEPTAEKLQAALKSLLGKNIKALIIDVRNNPGGLLESAVDVCSFFLPPKTLIVSTQGRQPSQKREFHSGRGWKFQDYPVAILINQGSASAAEILAGCLQDWGEAVLVGEKSFGKGSVQNVIELPDGSALRLTTAMYYTPSKRVIHKHGIEPDIEVKLSDEEIRQIIEVQRTPLKPGESKPLKDRQLQRAIDTLSSYGVYKQSRKKRRKEPHTYSESKKQ